MKQRTTIGLIGAGRIGRVHAENLAFNVAAARLVAVSDVDEEAASRCAEDFDIPRVLGNAELMNDPEIEVVFICASTKAHVELIGQAARAGKDIFCEKPLAFDLGSIDEALAVAQENGVRLQVGFNRRFDPSFRHIREEIARGAIGEVRQISIVSRDPGPPSEDYVRSSGGLFLDMSVHDFDMARYLTGADVEEVYAAAAVRVSPMFERCGDVDTALLTLRLADGTLAMVDNSREAVYGYDQRIEVLGSKGALASSNHTPHNVVHSSSRGVCAAKPHPFFRERYATAFVAEVESFLAVREEGREPTVTAVDARKALAVALAARKSWLERGPVRVDEVEPTTGANV